MGDGRFFGSEDGFEVWLRSWSRIQIIAVFERRSIAKVVPFGYLV